MKEKDSLPLKVIFKCGHSIVTKVFKYKWNPADPCGILWQYAINRMPIYKSTLCGMCKEDKRWKS